MAKPAPEEVEEYSALKRYWWTGFERVALRALLYIVLFACAASTFDGGLPRSARDVGLICSAICLAGLACSARV